MEMHACRDCRENLRVEDFPTKLDRRNPDNIVVRRDWQCRPCKRLEKKEFRRKNPGKDRQYKLKMHGLTLEAYQVLLEAQDYRCAICQRSLDGDVNVDHDHSHCPGTYGCKECVRGLLCSPCNKGLGMFGDEELYLLSAVDYLRKHRR